MERISHWAHQVYSHEHPHHALGGAYLGDIYARSARVHEPPADPQYPFHERTIRMTRCGRICFNSRKINFSIVYSDQLVGVLEVARPSLAGQLPGLRSGSCGNDEDRAEPGPNPFIPDKVLTMCPEWTLEASIFASDGNTKVKGAY